ncbi:DUF2391 family protein [Natranaeroarchaeum aerophilus]|uniref:DUF2391 domain-containing protein n=1 Tax=Natranaeroarchaeum aerophilus TaxID=2917711 RepID=A0AAE3FST1_9EURY|nr:DUF2391 domain-containing protein [Natranaeroarchaeum aerophilus]MCL9814263.1 DUF2391 domain-containing protein [Natranaeroarchaeum aerophilus]
MSSEGKDQRQSPTDYDINDVLRQLDELEGTVDTSKERQEVRRTRRMLESVPGSDRIRKYTSRDIAEGFVGGIIFALPLLVEDGVFEIAEWFVEFTVASIPIFFVINVLFIVGLVSGLLYFTDIRNVQVRLLFGFLPKRLTAVLLISLCVAAGTMLMWGRLTAEGPSNFEMLARITVIWAAAALGASLGDILPGESSGTDIADRVAEIGDRESGSPE